MNRMLFGLSLGLCLALIIDAATLPDFSGPTGWATAIAAAGAVVQWIAVGATVGEEQK